MAGMYMRRCGDHVRGTRAHGSGKLELHGPFGRVRLQAVKLASLISLSRSCLRAALIDLNKSPVSQNICPPSRQHSTLLSKFSFQTAYGLSILQHPRTPTPRPKSFLQLHSAVQQDSSAAYSFNNSGVPATPSSESVINVEAGWLEPVDLNQPGGGFLSESDISASPPRFNWRNRLSSRIPFHFSTPANRKRYPSRKFPVLPTTQLGEQYHNEIFNYQKHFLPLLESEEAECRNEVTERLSTWSLDRLKREGFCLTDVFGYWCNESHFGKPVAAFQFGPGMKLPENLKFENGYQVMISRANPLEEQPFKGSVVGLSDTRLKLAFPCTFDIDGQWRIDLDQINFIFERMKKAISAFHYDLDFLEQIPRSTDQEYVLLGTSLKDVLLRSGDHHSKNLPSEPHGFHALQASDDTSYPKDVLSHDVREFSSQEFNGVFKDDMRIHSWVERYSLDDPLVVEGDPNLGHLNRSQIKAMAMMIGKRISLVQGPPGTGKTKTIIETIKLLRNHFEVPYPILVCTYTNVAVDNLVEGLAKVGLKPLRVGFGTRIREPLKDYSLDHLLEQHPLQPLYVETLALLENLHSEINDLTNRITGTVKKIKELKEGGSAEAKLRKRVENMCKVAAAKEREQHRLQGKKYGLQQEMLHDIVKSADVVCTTCISAASNALNVSDFPVVFIDEASMSTEPATLIPIMKGSRHLALIGDHKQLPPVIVSREAQSQGLGVSLFERLTEEGIVPSVMLDIQYRMHPSISCFPSWEFYNNSIQDGTKDKEGNVVCGLEPPFSATYTQLLGEPGKDDVPATAGEGRQRQGSRPSVIFLDHNGYESKSGRSRVNNDEVQIVVSLVEDLLLQNPQLRGQDIGIIAPYVAQINLLIRLLNTDARHQARFRGVLGSKRYQEMHSVEVKTVDGFEGREKDIIIFSTVRNNGYGKIGFLADRRRLNVGLTRAKRGLFVVGSIRTIGGPATIGATVPGTNPEVEPTTTRKGKRGGKGADSWKRYVEWLIREGLVVRLVGEKLNRVLYGNLRKEYVESSGKL